jgi:hypothetical protein
MKVQCYRGAIEDMHLEEVTEDAMLSRGDRRHVSCKFRIFWA